MKILQNAEFLYELILKRIALGTMIMTEICNNVYCLKSNTFWKWEHLSRTWICSIKLCSGLLSASYVLLWYLPHSTLYFLNTIRFWALQRHRSYYNHLCVYLFLIFNKYIFKRSESIGKARLPSKFYSLDLLSFLGF